MVTATNRIRVVRNRIPQVIAGIRGMDNLVTKVGFPEGGRVASAASQQGEQVDDMSELSRIAFTLEFGAPHLGNKKWPFMTKAFQSGRSSVESLTNQLYDRASRNRLETMRALSILGEFHQEQVKEQIRLTRSPRLEQSTIDRKGSSKPLIDTGQMIQSVTHKEGTRT
jgi:hypothetical protein